MGIPRYYTVGAVARDLGTLKELDERLEALGVPPGSLLVLARRRDERLVGVTLPDARKRRIEAGLSRSSTSGWRRWVSHPDPCSCWRGVETSASWALRSRTPASGGSRPASRGRSGLSLRAPSSGPPPSASSWAPSTWRPASPCRR